MVRLSRVLVLPLAALALFLAAGRGSAQTVVVTSYPGVACYPPRVVVPAPAPVAAYYSPATVTTYRYGAVLPRRRLTVTTYSPAVVTYAPPPVVVAPAPRVARYYSPVYLYP